jgi:hypothetical protein
MISDFWRYYLIIVPLSKGDEKEFVDPEDKHRPNTKFKEDRSQIF